MISRKIILSTSLMGMITILSIAYTLAQQPTCQWVKSAPGSDYDIAVNSAVDYSGNTIVVGSFKSTDLQLQTDTLITAGGYDVFMIKYDHNGNEIWCKRFGSQGEESIASVAVDQNGDIYITGTFNYQLVFANDSLSSIGYQWNGFLAKIDSSGNALWGRKMIGTGLQHYVVPANISCDANNNVVVSGRFKSQYFTVGQDTTFDINAVDVFLLKFNSAGTMQWSNSFGGFMDDWGNGVACDAVGNIYLCGMYGANGITLGSFAVPNVGGSDIYLAKLDASGNVLWAKGVGSSGFEVGISVTVDANGNPILTGNFQSQTISFGTTMLYNIGISTMFVAKYNSAGVVQWAQSSSGQGRATGYDVATDLMNNVYVTGWYDSTSLQIGSNFFVNAGGEEVYLVKYNDAGAVQWGDSPSGTKNERCFGVACNNIGDVQITGMFESSPTSFCSFQHQNTTAAFQDFFIARYGITSGVDDIETSSFFNLYPVPTNNLLTIENFKSLPFLLNLYTFDGRKVAELYSEESTYSFSTSNLSDGIYFAQFIVDGKQTIKKINVIHQ